MNANRQMHRMVTAALFAALITVVTAYFLHIPIPTGGYIHLGDALIYLAASLLPAPYAIFAASVGAGLADLLTAPAWVLPTVIIKAVVAMLFTCKAETILTRRNVTAVFVAGVLSPALYSVAACIMSGTWATFVPQFVGTLAQGIGSGVVFLVLGCCFDRRDFKSRVAGTLSV